MTLVNQELAFSEKELEMGKALRRLLDDELGNAGYASESRDVICQISFDENDNVKWGNVYVPIPDGMDEGEEAMVWDIVHSAVNMFSGNTGFPSSLITVRSL